MKDAWTGEAVGIMHVHDITAKELSDKLGWNSKYLSAILNCKRKPKNAENIVMAALAEMTTDSN